MTGNDLLQLALAGGSAGGLSLGIVLVVARWTANFIAGRIDKREARLDTGTQRLIVGLQEEVDRLSGECTTLRERVSATEEEHAQCRRELMELRGLIQGRGDARQHAALIVAAEKRKGEK